MPFFLLFIFLVCVCMSGGFFGVDCFLCMWLMIHHRMLKRGCVPAGRAALCMDYRNRLWELLEFQQLQMPCLDPLLTGWAGEQFCGVATGPGRHCPGMCDGALLGGFVHLCSALLRCHIGMSSFGSLCDTVTIRETQ